MYRELLSKSWNRSASEPTGRQCRQVLEMVSFKPSTRLSGLGAVFADLRGFSDSVINFSKLSEPSTELLSSTWMSLTVDGKGWEKHGKAAG